MDFPFFYVILLFWAFLCKDALAKVHRSSDQIHDGKIVGGYSTTIEKFPYQVYLLVRKGNGYYQCGGSIISQQYVLTAAHCLTGVSRLYIRAGSTNSERGGAMYLSLQFVQHPKYNASSSDYDVALVRPMLPIRIDGRTTKIVKIADKGSPVNPGSNVVISGWGTTSENGQTSTTLRAVEIPTVSNDECRQSYRTITERMFCAGVAQGGKDSCQGDSGGPAVSKDSGVQQGIVSFGIGCARKGYPGVYARISSDTIRDWIKKVSGV